jgi:hypothetical protein
MPERSSVERGEDTAISKEVKARCEIFAEASRLMFHTEPEARECLTYPRNAGALLG